MKQISCVAYSKMMKQYNKLHTKKVDLALKYASFSLHTVLANLEPMSPMPLSTLIDIFICTVDFLTCVVELSNM